MSKIGQFYGWAEISNERLEPVGAQLPTFKAARAELARMARAGTVGKFRIRTRSRNGIRSYHYELKDGAVASSYWGAQ